MSWVAVGVGVGTTALSLGGNAIIAANSGGGGGGGINSKQIKEDLAEYLGQINAAVSAGRGNVSGSVSEMDDKIEDAANKLTDASNRMTVNFWKKLGIENKKLINTASALVKSYDGDVNRALQTLQQNIGYLNEAYSKDMGAEISRYGSVEDAINAQLAADENVAETKFLERVAENKAEYEGKSTAEIDASKAEQMSLGDQFVSKSDAATGRFDAFLSSSPALLDELSKSVQKTRLDLIANADPRAAELSAIADENAAAMMSGRISADVQANLARSGAMRALQGGFGADSGMGRNLQARDLGLTSLDLMGRGYDMFDRQRRLNYDTKVAGVEETAFGLFGQRQAGEADLMRTTIGTAESDRNQRIGAVQEASGQKLQTFDRLFGANMGVADTLRSQDMTLAGQLSDNRRDANIRSTGMRTAATQDIYNNNLGLTNTVFNTGLGLAGQKLSTGLSVAGDVYKTNVGGADRVYTTRTGVFTDIFGARTQGAMQGMQAKTAYEAAALNATAGALGNVAATQANLPVISAAQNNARSMQTAQLWGSALQAGSSLAGSYLGSQNWNQNTGRTFGGNTYGGYNPTSSSPYYGNVSSASARPVAIPT